ncbi:hypothetical protein J0E37_001428 [Campylobacter upsaliensis]|nr:hypothetical protein [Campylobacter upsaliensis]
MRFRLKVTKAKAQSVPKAYAFALLSLAICYTPKTKGTTHLNALAKSALST